ncbi:MAG: RNA polymerase sigma factor [Gemmatimonadetes bacterium]|nr:RNA polymerase sigma factor [Gemmatimonadota bacterium]MYF72230.1 RNA polymerase sigma factor [Gemmatimonadota bacterium]MYK51113.1 RNA polymerase sigma factor [Gemmatimonadota bacterium]
MNKRSDIENDVQLIHMIKAGDKSAFGKLYHLHQNRVRAIVGRYVKDRDETEDLIQVVFMKVFQSLRHFRGESAFTTYLTRIAINVGRSHLRSRLSRKNGLETIAQHMPEPITLTTPEDSVIKKERHQRLTQGLRTLPKAQQRAMWLRYIKELSYREIVWEMQAPLGTVKIWLHRGRHQLRRALEKQEVGSWAG